MDHHRESVKYMVEFPIFMRSLLSGIKHSFIRRKIRILRTMPGTRDTASSGGCQQIHFSSGRIKLGFKITPIIPLRKPTMPVAATSNSAKLLNHSSDWHQSHRNGPLTLSAHCCNGYVWWCRRKTEIVWLSQNWGNFGLRGMIRWFVGGRENTCFDVQLRYHNHCVKSRR